jgi:hypothetical protein
MLDLPELLLDDNQVGEIGNYGEHIFNTDPVPVSRSVGRVLDQLAKKCSMSVIGNKLWKLTGSLSMRTWGKRVEKIKKAKEKLTQNKLLHSKSNWQKFLASDVIAPLFPPKEKNNRPNATRVKKGGKTKNGGTARGEPAVDKLLKPVDSSPASSLRKRPLELQMQAAVSVAVNAEAAREKEAAAHAGIHSLYTLPTLSPHSPHTLPTPHHPSHRLQ